MSTLRLHGKGAGGAAMQDRDCKPDKNCIICSTISMIVEKYQSFVIDKLSGRSQESSREKAWLKRVLSGMERMDKDKKFREKIQKMVS